MERINSLKRPQILKELQTHKKYCGSTQKEISTKFKDIDDLRSELHKLEKSRRDKTSRSQKKKDTKEKKLVTVHLLSIQEAEDYPEWRDCALLSSFSKEDLLRKFIDHLKKFNTLDEEDLDIVTRHFNSFGKNGDIWLPDYNNAISVTYVVTTL